MNLNISKRKNGRTYLSIDKGYRDKITKKSRKNVIRSLGYLDELEKKYPNPIEYFRQVAKEMTQEEKKEKRITLTVNTEEKLPENSSRKNFGYAAILKIYHQLELDYFLKNKARSKNFEFNTNSIMILLVVSRLLNPGSKKKAFDDKDTYFERFNFSLDDLYRALTHFHEIAIKLQRYLHQKIAKKYGSDTSIVYYDVTNYYFEIDITDEIRKFGKPKQNRKKPVIQMGLAMDANGIPIHYELFPGNKLDKETFRSVIGEIRRNYETGRIVVVADMGIITGDNIYYLLGGQKSKSLNGYIFSFSVRGGTQNFKQYILDEKNYLNQNGKHPTKDTDFKIKSRIIARVINVTMTNGKTKKQTVYEKQVIFWAKKYQDKARAQRAEVIKKALDLVDNPLKYTQATSYGAAAYVINLEVDKKTGEIHKGKKTPAFNFEKLAEEEKYDGYYAIVTSELEMSDNEIIEKYRGLWEIEETFKITKSELKSRPVYVNNADHINAHFLTCFIALTIMRIIQHQTNRKYSPAVIIDCLKKITCSNEHENIYLFEYRNEISDTIGRALDIDFTHKRLRLGEIKQVLGEVKK